MKLYFAVIAYFIAYGLLQAQPASIMGNITAKGNPVNGAVIAVNNKTAFSDVNGNYKIIDLKKGSYILTVKHSGFIPINKEIAIDKVENIYNIELKEDALSLEQVVVSSNRNEINKYQSAVIVNTIGKKLFQSTQSLSLSEGLSFTPGLRIENNCQNCGFTQLRMNGLQGPYAQILINSRPVFSALAGVYGLEMIPANLVDRVEIVRGAGSALFGGNAIAGTVNIITKDPIDNSFEINVNQALINFEKPDRTVNINASVVSQTLDKGLSIYGFNRVRDYWDANNDGYSEITKLNNNTLGFNSFWNTSAHSKLKTGMYFMNESRRGGNNFHLKPHQADIAEEVLHKIAGVNNSFEVFSSNYKHKLAFYQALQTINRQSYYGGGGRIINPGDTLTNLDIIALNAYGNSNDISINNGIQYAFAYSNKLNITVGSEWHYNKVEDMMPGYQRKINQSVSVLGNYLQLDYKPLNKLTIIAGGRLDFLAIDGKYLFNTDNLSNQKKLNVFVPRLSVMVDITSALKTRFSFAQGYRGPQAFDEDLHIETVGGAARFIILDPNLKTERSNSYTASLNYQKSNGSKQINMVVEGFLTNLSNQFVLSNQQELPNGIAAITKRNSNGSLVYGLNAEFNLALSGNFVVQSGATIQNAVFKNKEILWQSADSNQKNSMVYIQNLLRTPNYYGYLNIQINTTKRLSISVSGVYTGSMYVVHVIDAKTEKTIVKQTRAFFDKNVKISYKIYNKNNVNMQVYGGIQNILNSYQRDFDKGAARDAGYVYGPTRPLTIYAGLTFALE